MTDEKTGWFVITHADDESAVLKDVTDGQVLTLSSNPGVLAGDAIEATVGPEPPFGVTWRVLEVADRFSISVTHSAEDPTDATMAAIEGAAPGELSRRGRDDVEVHAIAVEPSGTDDAVRDVLEDEYVRVRAARRGASSVEVRSTPGVVSIRYVQDR